MCSTWTGADCVGESYPLASFKYCLSKVRIQNRIIGEVHFEDAYTRDWHTKEQDPFFGRRWKSLTDCRIVTRFEFGSGEAA